MRFGQRDQEESELIGSDPGRSKAGRRVKRVAGSRRTGLLGSAHDAGDPKVDWDSWDPEVYSAGFGSGWERNNGA